MMRGLWDRETVALILLSALMPLALTWLLFGGTQAALRLVLALVVSGLWHMIFMLARAQPPSFAGAIAANTTLRVLKLDCSQMKDVDAPQFVEALKANTTLKEFTAFQNEVRDRELRKAVKHVVRP